MAFELHKNMVGSTNLLYALHRSAIRFPGCHDGLICPGLLVQTGHGRMSPVEGRQLEKRFISQIIRQHDI
jgi:hypothetical protein